MNKQQIKEVLSWAESRGILANSTFEAQALKGIEEIGELTAAINKNDLPNIICEMGDVLVTNILASHFIDADIERGYRRSVGRIPYYWVKSVTRAVFEAANMQSCLGMHEGFYTHHFSPLIHIANHYNFTLETALQTALDKIQKRTGKMENGLFVKDKE